MPKERITPANELKTRHTAYSPRPSLPSSHAKADCIPSAIAIDEPREIRITAISRMPFFIIARILTKSLWNAQRHSQALQSHQNHGFYARSCASRPIFYIGNLLCILHASSIVFGLRCHPLWHCYLGLWVPSVRLLRYPSDQATRHRSGAIESLRKSLDSVPVGCPKDLARGDHDLRIHVFSLGQQYIGTRQHSPHPISW